MDIFVKINKLKQEIDSKSKKVFEITFLTGFFCHLFVMVGHYPCFSGIYSFISDFSGCFKEGRWMQVVLGRLEGNTTVPMYIGLIALLFWSLSVVLIVSIFNIKDKTLITVLSMVFVSFPVIASMNNYMYMWDAFAMACFWSCLGVYYWNQDQGIYKTIVSCLCFILSIASYQAVFAFAMVLIAYATCIDLLCGKEVNKTLKKAVHGAISSIVAVICWNIITNIILLIRGEIYRDKITVTLVNIVYGIRKAYEAFCWFLADGFVFNTLTRRILLITMIMISFLYCVGIWKENYKCNDKKIIRIIVIAISVLMYPILAGYAYVAVPDTTIVARLGFANIIIFISPFILCDRFRVFQENENEKKEGLLVTSVMSFAVCIVGVLAINMFFVIDNSAYMSAFQTYEKEYSLALRIVDRVECRPDYIEGMRVRLVEDGQCNYYNGISWEGDIDQFINGMAQSGNINMADGNNMGKFISQFIQTDMNIGWVEVEPEFIDSLECWPSDKCIGVDENGVMVVKFECAGY